MSLTRMVELDVTFVLTTGKMGRTKGAREGTGERCQGAGEGQKQIPCEIRHAWVHFCHIGTRDARALGFGSQGTDQMMADAACRHGSAVDRSAFVRNMKTELGVAAVKGGALVFHVCTCQLARVMGRALQKGV